MADIKVHILDFHGIFTHIEIVLENISTEPHTYYGINRWETPISAFSGRRFKSYIRQASSTFSFDIKANPDDIVEKWREYWFKTEKEANILTSNCGNAAQWFLKHFADIKEPSLSNISWNHLALGIIWPSFLPCPITLPGRIMSNAKFHINARTKPEQAQQYSRFFLYTSMAVRALLFVASCVALPLAVCFLTAGIGALAMVGAALVGVASACAFFKAYNVLSAKNIHNESKAPEDRAISKDASSEESESSSAYQYANR